MKKQYIVKKDYEDYALAKNDIIIFKLDSYYINNKRMYIGKRAIRLLHFAGIIEPYEPKPEPKFKVRDWVRFIKTSDLSSEHRNRHGLIGVIISISDCKEYIKVKFENGDIDTYSSSRFELLPPVPTKDGFPLVEGKEYLVEIVNGMGWYEHLMGLQVKGIFEKYNKNPSEKIDIFIVTPLKFDESYYIDSADCKIIRGL